MELSRYFRNYKVVIANTGYLSIVEILNLALPFVSLPYILRVVGTTNYGVIAFIQTVVSYFSIFINFGLDISAVKDVSVNRNDISRLSSLVSAVLWIKCCLFFISLLGISFAVCFVPYLFEHRFLLYCCFAICIGDILFPIWFYQGIERMKYLAVFRFVYVVFYTCAVFVFIKEETDYPWIAFLQSFGSILVGLISLFFLIRTLKIRLLAPDWRLMKRLFVESVPFFVSRLSVVFNSAIAKLMSGIFFSMQTVAAFDIAQKISNVALVPTQMFNRALYPNIAKSRDVVFVNKVFRINILVSFIIAFFIVVLSPLAITFFAGYRFVEAIELTRILAIWVFFANITYFIGAPILVSFGHARPFNKSVVYSSFVLCGLYAVFYLTDTFTIYTFAGILCGSELFILIYRLRACFGYGIFSLRYLLGTANNIK